MAAVPKPHEEQAPWGEYVALVGPMTPEQFAHFPWKEGWTYELHYGGLIAMPAPQRKHSIVFMRLGRFLGVYLESQQMGDITGETCYDLTSLLGAYELLCPDISYVAPQRLSAFVQRGAYPELAPDFVAEIASPRDTRPAMQKKAHVYMRAGVRLLWVIWPETLTVDVWQPSNLNAPVQTLSASDRLDGLDVIPGFTYPVADIFPEE